MRLLGIAGPAEAGTTALVEALADRLSERGRVATVTNLTREPDVDAAGADRHRRTGAATAVGVTDDGWVATGDALSLDEALDALAPAHDYALLEGFPDAAAPTVVLGDGEATDPVVARAPDAEAADVDAVLSGLEASEPFETLSSLVERAKRASGADRAGAVATFTGRVRERDDPADAPTTHLEFEKYEGVADRRLAAIREELTDREGVFEVLLHHRTGVVAAGEDIVFVVVLAGHREAAFRTVSDGIDRLKAEVPLFKKEVTVEEAFWRHERP